MFFRRSLQTKILLLVICGLAIIFAVFTYFGLQTLEESTQRSLEERLVVAQLIAAHADEHVEHTLTLLTGVSDAAASDTTETTERARAQLKALMPHSPFFDYGVFATDTNGTVLWSEPSFHFPSGQRLPGFPMLQGALQADQPAVSDLLLEPRTGDAFALLAVPVFNSEGEFVGAVGSAGNLAVDGLTLLLAPVTMGKTGYVEIVDREGRVLASSKATRLFQKDDHADRFDTLIREKRPVVRTCHRCHEADPSTASAEMRQNDVLAFSPMDKAPWGVAVRQLEDEVLAGTRQMALRIALVALPLFAMALAAAWYTTRRVVRPIRLLTMASERIAQGDLDFVVKPFSKDELGALAAAFDSMRLKLRTSHEEIESWNRDLERRVELRTRDLSTIFEASQIASSTLDLDSLLGEIVARLVKTIRQADAGVLYLKSSEDDTFTPRSSYGYDEEALAGLRLTAGEGIAGKVLGSGRATLWYGADAIVAAMSDLSGENSARWKAATATTSAPHSVVGVPMVAHGRMIGCLVLDNLRPEQAFGDVDLSLVQTIADRIAIATENARLYEEVQRKEQLRGQLLEKVIVAQEEERQRIARELHDETGQSLTALAISLASADEALPTNVPGAKEALVRAKGLADTLLAEIRRLISDLRPTILDDLGLVPALRRYASTNSELLQLNIQLQVEGRRRRFSPQAETALFRIVQEAITNVAKHAQAKNVIITLTFERYRAMVVVQDDGRGFDVTEMLGPARPHRAVGLLGMRERATLLGGTLDIKSQPGTGTILTVALPLEGEELSAHD